VKGVTMSKNFYGWRADNPDQRDDHFQVHFLQLMTLPSLVDLRALCPAIYDQGQLGSCTANGIAGCLEFDQIKQKEQNFTPSRLFIYYNERVMENSVDSDAGANIRDGIKSVAKQGAPDEKEWPYNINKFAVKPTTNAYADALNHKSILYQRVTQKLSQMKVCLSQGYPFTFGFTVYESFESDQVAQTGVVTMPSHNERVLGGHCVMAVGYDDSQNAFICRNSWGTQWGMSGYFTMPYMYLVSRGLSSDFWVIKTVQ